MLALAEEMLGQNESLFHRSYRRALLIGGIFLVQLALYWASSTVSPHITVLMLSLLAVVLTLHQVAERRTTRRLQLFNEVLRELMHRSESTHRA